MIAAAIFAGPDGIDPGTLIIIGLATICLLMVLLVIVLVSFIDREQIRIDPHAAAHGDVPGFSREQLSQFRSHIHDDARRAGR